MEPYSNLQHHLDKRFDRLDAQLDQLDGKLDDHMSRIAKAETEISWVKGAGKLVVTLLISLLGFIAQVFWNHSTK